MTLARCTFRMALRALNTLFFTPIFTLFFTLFCALALVTPTTAATPTRAIAQAEPAATLDTVITVDTSADLDSGSTTKTCNFSSGVFTAAGDGCTLRRAIVEASALPQAQRPVTITFNLPPGEGVDGLFTIAIDDPLILYTSNDTNGLDNNGSVTIDGDTQPGGRINGPKVMIDTNDNSLEVESENNIIRNLAFKGGGAIFLKAEGNTVSGVWMGLSDDGQEIDFREPGNEFRMAGGGIFISADNNLVENNTISGAFAKAVDIDGSDNNIVRNNQIGTRADGTVPAVPPASLCVRSLLFDAAQWYGGWGISLGGSNNEITNNRIAGLQILQSANDTPPQAIEIFGANHLISGNIIGIDSDGTEVGVCGQGIKVAGNGTEILDNQVIGSRAGFEDDAMTAIMAADTSPAFGGVTVRRNIVKDGPGNVYAFGPGVASSLRLFNPAKVTSINGTTVEGGSGDDSPCPNCLIDLYADDIDDNGEALTYLGSTTTNADGDFNFTLGSALAPNTGIRTSSTVPSSGIITGFGEGTTTKVSKLFLAMQAITISGPITGEVGTAYAYTITAAPATATTPIDFAVQATDKPLQTLNDSQSRAIVGNYQWDTPGTKTISVTAENDLGTIMGTLEVEISSPTVAMSGVSITGPTTGEVGESYQFTITVTPTDATPPFDYTVNTTDKSQQALLDSPNSVIVATYSWANVGVKTINVLVENEAGSVTDNFNITITASPQSDSEIYLPKLDK